jgi:hypothetical protein
VLAQTYFGDRQDAKHGRLRADARGRFNPFLNAVTQLDGAQQAVGLVSPLYQALADQMFHESSFTGQTGGSAAARRRRLDRPRNYFGTGSPTSELLGLVYPYRVATKTGIPGVVKPLAAQPVRRCAARLAAADDVRRPGRREGRPQVAPDFEDQGAGKRLASALLPVFPQRTSSPAVVSRELEREEAIRVRNSRKPGARKRRRRKKRARTGTAAAAARAGAVTDERRSQQPGQACH